MEQTQPDNLSAVKYEVIVQKDGHISLTVPFSPGKRVTVFVVQEQEIDHTFEDVLLASTSSMDFWDNAYDDEDWNER
jgi:hypothetical protein